MDPFDPEWTETRLRPLADRAQAGEPSARLGDELFTLLWPWALRTAERMARRLPPGADRDALCGEVLLEVFQATRRIDWDRYQSWPALLRNRLRNAWSAAARAEDPLSRSQRTARRAFLAAEEELTQRLGRTPTAAERRSLAGIVSPQGRSAPVLFAITVAGCSTGHHLTATPSSDADDPAVCLERIATQLAVRAWIDEDLPVPLATEIRALLSRDEGDRLNQDLLRRLKPFLGSLQKRLAEDAHHSPSDGSST